MARVQRVQKFQKVQRVVVSPSAMSMKPALRDLPPPSMGEGDRVSGGGGMAAVQPFSRRGRHSEPEAKNLCTCR